MKPINIIYFLLCFLFLKCKDNIIDFNIEKIELSQAPCIPQLGKYLFYIKGNFNESPSVTNIITFYLDSSNFKAICYPLEKTSVSNDQLQCEINTYYYPLNEQNIFLPINPPIIEGYNFPNWKQILGENPGISNKIPEENIKCLPKELNSYNINFIKSQGCSNNKNIILMKGSWSDESKIIPQNFKIELSNKNIANCLTLYINQLQCEIDGYGKITFNDNYFKNGINIFKINKTELSVNIDKCDFSSFISLDKLSLLLIILLI